MLVFVLRVGLGLFWGGYGVEFLLPPPLLLCCARLFFCFFFGGRYLSPTCRWVVNHRCLLLCLYRTVLRAVCCVLEPLDLLRFRGKQSW